MRIYLRILIAKLKSCGTLNLYIMKAMKKKLVKAQSGTEVKGSKGSKASQVIAAISGTATGAAGLIKNARDKKKKRKAQEEMSKRISNAQKVNTENKNETLMEMEQMGQYKKGGVKMKTGGMVNSNAKLAVQKVAKGKVGGKSKAPKSAVPKAKYGMTMKRK